MKNRKAPVMLFGVVVVAVAAMAVYNASLNRATPEQEQQAKEEKVSSDKMTEEDRAKAKADLMSALPDKNGKTASTPDRKGPVPVGEGAPGTSMEPAKEPTILVKKYTASRPKPNDSSTATHWYDEESRSAKLAEQNEKGGG